jgi:hypothetical protein
MSPKTTPSAPRVRTARYFPSGSAGACAFSVPVGTASEAPEGERDGVREGEDSPESVFNGPEV